MENIMARKSIQDRLSQLDAQRKTLQTRLGKQERTMDTRRKILLGALVLHRLEDGKREFDVALREWLGRELPGFLTRDDDKALFTDLLAVPSASELEETVSATARAARDSGNAHSPAPGTPGAAGAGNGAAAHGASGQPDFLPAQKTKPDKIEAGA